MKNNNQTITEYYIAHRDTIIDWATRRGIGTDEAQDLVQDVFMRLLRTDKMISTITLPALAYQTFCHLLYDRWRHRKCMERHEHYLKGQPQSEDGLSVISAHETRVLLEQGMARLDEHSCRILRMNIEDGKKVGEIAQDLNMKYKTAENKLYLARKEIRQYMRRIVVDASSR